MVAIKLDNNFLPIGNQPYLKVAPSECQHENGFTNNVCNDCGFTCHDHDFHKGVCQICGEECHHGDIDDGYCLDCGLEYHEFFDMDYVKDYSDDHE